MSKIRGLLTDDHTVLRKGIRTLLSREAAIEVVGEVENSSQSVAVCRKIVERHGGTITASSKSQPGATFVVTLPLKQLEVERST